MQEVFEKIISKINEKIEHYDSRHKILTDSGMFSDADRIAERMVELDFTRKIVKQEAEKYNNGWIPCSSGVLPKRSNSYCVTKMCENNGNPIYETCHEIFWINDNKWDCERDEDCEWRVIAWKEKDKPYKPKGE